MTPWYRAVTPRKEVREGRSFNPDEFAIALEQVVAGTAPEDYRDAEKFFERNWFTRALREHCGLVLRRLSGETANTAPVLTLITQFGGGKTHTLTTLYHLANSGPAANGFSGVESLLSETGLSDVPAARVAVFVGNAWDPQEGRETPWHDIARQIAGEAGIAALGPSAKTTPPGTESLGRIFELAGRPVLVLFDEVLNFANRHRGMAAPFHAFIQNLTVAMTGFRQGAAVISLPRSQVEMTDFDMQWQEKITKVVRRVAKDLIVNDEGEIGEVIRRRLFEDLGDERQRKKIAREYADWCFERRAQLPPEWTAVDSVSTETRAREFLQGRFDACYPFHPATLSVFQRKWQTVPQYQQTRGTLAMLAQWISAAYKDSYSNARTEPLLTLGSAPLDAPDFRSVVLGQLGETRLGAAIEADIAGQLSHARALDASADGHLKGIHRRVATAILFESSGGQSERIAHLPELRFALGEPDIDTTSVDNAALALESKAYYIRKFGTDGFKINYKPTLRKVVSDRRASLDAETDVLPAIDSMVKQEFEKGRTVPVNYFPADSSAISDSPRLTLVVMQADCEWNGNGEFRTRIAEWTESRGTSPRLYPGAIVWCLKKPGRELREKTETMLAWKRVKREDDQGTLSGDFDRSDRAEIQTNLHDAESATKDEVWASYRYVVLSDSNEPDRLKVIDLGAGHASSNEPLSGRVIAALKSQALLNDSVGAGYIDRNWPPALKESGAWPLSSLRQSFLNGALTRLIDPDSVLKAKIVEFVERGDFGLASGLQPDGKYTWVWFAGYVDTAEVRFDGDVFLLRKSVAEGLKNGTASPVAPGPATTPAPEAPSEPGVPPLVLTSPTAQTPGTPGVTRKKLRIIGTIPPETWNRLGTRLIPKLRSASDLQVGIEFNVTSDSGAATSLTAEIRQILEEMGVSREVRIEEAD